MPPSDTYFVRLVDADGQPTGAEKKVLHATLWDGPGEAAEFFAEELVDQEMREQRASIEERGVWHDVQYTIDVRLPAETTWKRYVVTCKCKLEFRAANVGKDYPRKAL